MQVARVEFNQDLVDMTQTPRIFIVETGGKHKLMIEVGLVAEKIIINTPTPDPDPEIVHNFRDGEVLPLPGRNLVTPGNIKVKLAKLDRRKAGSFLSVEATISSKIPGTGTLVPFVPGPNEEA